jgi:signal transduction histidine kinase/CheY-like chemotaxis protein
VDRRAALGRSMREFAELSHTLDRVVEIGAELRVANSWQGRFHGRSGELIDASIAAVRDAEGAIQHYISVARDVTREVELERQLRRQQKLEAIGTLASGVAHDFNNLLTGVLGYAELLAEGRCSPVEVAEAARVIGEAARRGAELTSQLLGFGLQTPLRSEPVDVHEVIGEVVRLLSRTLARSVSLQLDLAAPRSTVHGDPGQLQQVFLNLALNARDAMPEGGALLFRTEIVPGGEPPRIAVAVRDTGVGIAEPLRERIFEPFFTTKQSEKGSGMGLSVVYGIVQSHGGSISLESEVGVGTQLEVQLPLASEEAPARTARAADVPVRGQGRVLVVDDEAGIRRVAARMLRHLGYQVDDAADGQEALARLRASPAAYALALLDLDMPGMDGRVCLHGLREIRPDLPVVVSTGIPASELGEIAKRDTVGLLPKPYDLHGLSQAVAAVLARDGRSVQR